MKKLLRIILQIKDTWDIGRICETCPCGDGAMLRYIKSSEEETDGLRLHYERCNICGFEYYAHNEDNIKNKHKLYAGWSIK